MQSDKIDSDKIDFTEIMTKHGIKAGDEFSSNPGAFMEMINENIELIEKSKESGTAPSLSQTAAKVIDWIEGNLDLLIPNRKESAVSLLQGTKASPVDEISTSDRSGDASEYGKAFAANKEPAASIGDEGDPVDLERSPAHGGQTPRYSDYQTLISDQPTAQDIKGRQWKEDRPNGNPVYD